MRITFYISDSVEQIDEMKTMCTINIVPSMGSYSSIKIQNDGCPGWGSNSRPSDYETDALPTALPRLHKRIGKNFWDIQNYDIFKLRLVQLGINISDFM